MSSPPSPTPPSPVSSAGSRRWPDHDGQAESPPTLEQLVKHFVASKRSLHTQTVLWRANDMVNTARDRLHENAVLAANNTAIRSLVQQQVERLQAVRNGIDEVEAQVEAEFKQLLLHVDTAFASLNSTLAVLRETAIEAALQPPGTSQKHLYDFIDSTTISSLEAALRACIDRYNDARAALDDSNDAFDTALDNLNSSMAHMPAALDDSSPIPDLYRRLEGHAKEAAQAFQSLVQHFDLCVTALQHTEGGRAAATQATGDVPIHSAGDFAASLQPISEDERCEMLNILSKDAQEVDHVVAEIRNRDSEMTFLLDKIELHINLLRDEASALSTVLNMLSRIADQAKSHTATSRAFHTSWLDDTRPTLLTGVQDWEDQRDFYERFDLAYAELLVEVSSRRRRHDKAKRKAEEAQKELDRLHAEDEKAREQFALTQGDFLPLDIWPGLRDKPRQYQVRATALNRSKESGDLSEENEGEHDEAEDGGVQSIPQLARNVVERALTRVKRRM